jgi:hypothetical protein
MTIISINKKNKKRIKWWVIKFKEPKGNNYSKLIFPWTSLIYHSKKLKIIKSSKIE